MGARPVPAAALAPREAPLRAGAALVQRGEFLRGAAEMDEYAEIVDGIEPTAAEAIRHRAQAARALLN